MNDADNICAMCNNKMHTDIDIVCGRIEYHLMGNHKCVSHDDMFRSIWLVLVDREGTWNQIQEI